MARALTLVLVLAAIALSGCAGGDETAEQPRNTDRSIVTLDEIRTADIVGTAHDVVRRLRPGWLHRRGRQPIRVYLDDTPFGASEQALTRIAASSVRYMERLDGPQATARFGRGHSGGAIIVRTN